LARCGAKRAGRLGVGDDHDRDAPPVALALRLRGRLLARTFAAVAAKCQARQRTNAGAGLLATGHG
jgi:hypothetical protein